MGHTCNCRPVWNEPLWLSTHLLRELMSLVSDWSVNEPIWMPSHHRESSNCPIEPIWRWLHWQCFDWCCDDAALGTTKPKIHFERHNSPSYRRGTCNMNSKALINVWLYCALLPWKVFRLLCENIIIFSLSFGAYGGYLLTASLKFWWQGWRRRDRWKHTACETITNRTEPTEAKEVKNMIND